MSGPASDQQQRLLGGRYRVLELLGRGGMGTVWSAQDELLGRSVAVKEVLPPHLSEPELRELRQRTLQEARAAARISSPAALTVHDVVEEDGHPWIVMELLAPRTLEDVLHERRLSPQQAATLGLTLLSALQAAATAGVLHRDVKPGNVMFRGAPDDDLSRAVLTDFGIARFVGDATMTATGTLVGSPAYVAPERARGLPATLASDLWSLGVTLWTAVEGRSPFEREGALPTLTAVVTEDVPPAHRAGPLAPVLQGLLRKDPEQRTSPPLLRNQLQAVASGGRVAVPDRPATRTAVLADVRRAPAPAPSRVRRSEPAPKAPPPVRDPDGGTGVGVRPRGRRALLGGLAAVLLVGGLGAGLVALDPFGTDDPVVGAEGSEDPGEPSAPTDASTGAPATPEDEAPATSDPPASTSSTEPAADPPEDGGAAPSAVPEGFRLHEDATGFAVAVPEAWTDSQTQSGVRFSDPDSSASLLVAQTDDPQDDPVQDWQDQERSVSQRLGDYALVGAIEGHELRGWTGADWEFTYTSEGEQRHALNRNLVTTPGEQAYALLWTVPEAQSEERRDDFDAVFDSFAPAG